MRIPHISFKQKHLFFLCAGVTAVLLCFCLRSPDFDSFTMEIFWQILPLLTLRRKKSPLELSQPPRIRKVLRFFGIFR